MDIDIILEPDLSPAQVAEIGVEAERLGIRALWSSNYHMQCDPFLSLAPAAAATSKLIIGPLAVSPCEMYPLKMGYACVCHKMYIFMQTRKDAGRPHESFPKGSTLRSLL